MAEIRVHKQNFQNLNLDWIHSDRRKLVHVNILYIQIHIAILHCVCCLNSNSGNRKGILNSFLNSTQPTQHCGVVVNTRMHVSIFSFSERIDPSLILLLSFLGRLLEVSVEGGMNLLHNGCALHDSCLHFHLYNSIKDESSLQVV